MVVPCEVLDGQRVGPRLLDDLLVRRPELGEVEVLAALDARHQQLPGAVGLGHVDGQTEVDVPRHHHGRLAVDDVVAVVHGRVRLQRLHHGEADQVRVRHLAAAGPAQVVVDHHALVDQQLHRQRADAGGGRHRQRGVHVLRGAGGGAPEHGPDRLLQVDGGAVRRVRRIGRYAATVAGGRRPGVLVRRRPLHGRRSLGRRGGGAAAAGCAGPLGAGAGEQSASPERLPSVERLPGGGAVVAALAAGGGRRCAAEPLPVGVLAVAPFPVEPLAAPPSWWVLKYCAQLGSTEPGSETYCSYISSSSQSLAPNSSARASVAVWVELDGSGTGATIAFFRRGLVGEGPSHREKGPARVVCLGYRNSHTTVPLVRLTERASRVCTASSGRSSVPAASQSAPTSPLSAVSTGLRSRCVESRPQRLHGPGPGRVATEPASTTGRSGCESRSSRVSTRCPAARSAIAAATGSSAWRVDQLGEGRQPDRGVRVAELDDRHRVAGPGQPDDGLRQRSRAAPCPTCSRVSVARTASRPSQKPDPSSPSSHPQPSRRSRSSPATIRPATAPVPATSTYPSGDGVAEEKATARSETRRASDRHPRGSCGGEERRVGAGPTGQADHRRRDPVGRVGPGLRQTLLGDRTDPLRRDLQTDAVGVPGRSGGDTEHLAGDGGHRDPRGGAADVRPEKQRRRCRFGHASPRPRLAQCRPDHRNVAVLCNFRLRYCTTAKHVLRCFSIASPARTVISRPGEHSGPGSLPREYHIPRASRRTGDERHTSR